MGQKGNEDLFRYILKASNEMEDDEKRFQFVRNQVSSLEECMKDGPNKHATIKSLANWAVKEFTSIEKFKSDKRMLDLWKLLGKYSENMGMEGVLENLHRIGFFKDCPEFYLMWAEHWASKGKLENFNKIMQICKDNCPMSQFDAKELFKPLLIKYFDMENSLDGKTMDLIKMLADKPEDVRPELTLFPYERTIAPDPKHKDARKSQMLEGFEHHRQQRESLPPPPSTTNREEFSVFKDPTSVIHHQPAQSQNLMQQVPEEPLQENKEKKGIEAQQRGNVAEEFVPKKSTMNKPTNPELNADKNQSKMVTDNFGRRRSFVPDLNDVTVAGSHGKFSSAMLTSTPRRSMNPINFDPVCAFSPHRNAELMFFDDLEQSKNKEGGLFGGVGTSGDKEPITGGSKLQKRLSLMPNEPPQKQIQAGEQNPFEGKNSIEDLLFFDDLEKSMNEEDAGGVGTGGKEKEPMTGGSKLQKRLSLIANEPPQQQNQAAGAQEKAKKIARPSDLLKTMPRLNIGSTIEEVTEEKENTTNTNSSFSSPFRKKTKVGGGDEPSECQPEESGKQQKEADN